MHPFLNQCVTQKVVFTAKKAHTVVKTKLCFIFKIQRITNTIFSEIKESKNMQVSD